MRKCEQCKNAYEEENLLVCGHQLCDQCLSQKINTSQAKLINTKAVICPNCEVMSIVHKHPTKIHHLKNPQTSQIKRNRLFCQDCQVSICDINQFLQSSHRMHSVIQQHQLLPQIYKQMLKFHKSIDLQSQALVSEIEYLAKQKSKVCYEYQQKLLQIKTIFQRIRKQIQQIQKKTLQTMQTGMYDILSKIDSKITQTRKQMQKSSSYLQCLKTNLSSFDQYEQATNIIHFHLDTQTIFTQYCQNLANIRLNRQTSCFNFNKKPNQSVLQQIICLLSQANLFPNTQRPKLTNRQIIDPIIKNQPNKKNSFEIKSNQIDEYFQNKRKELFCSDTVTQNQSLERSLKVSQSDSRMNINRISPQASSPLRINGNCYDIQGRINLLRRKLHTDENQSLINSKRFAKKPSKKYKD